MWKGFVLATADQVLNLACGLLLHVIPLSLIPCAIIIKVVLSNIDMKDQEKIRNMFLLPDLSVYFIKDSLQSLYTYYTMVSLILLD